MVANMQTYLGPSGAGGASGPGGRRGPMIRSL